MGYSSKITSVVVLLISIFIGLKIHNMCVPRELPDIPHDQYWGPGVSPSKMDNSIRPYQIKFSQEMIADLKDRLKRTRYSEPLEGIAFQYGFNQNALKPIINYWANEYNFAQSEKYLNQFPQFKTNIQGLDIHFLRVIPNIPKGNKVKVLPLLLLHGWPGSVREFYKIIPMLTTVKENTDFVFEVIVPSLPGFGFSQASSKPGLGCIQIAVIMRNLMKRLGHEKFYIQGGDWGSVIGSHLSTIFQDDVLGYHSNFAMLYSPLSNLKMFIGSFWPSQVISKEHEHRLYPIKARLSSLIEESGYFHEQATKPDTVGTGLNDSPAGLAAWLLEKFSVGTNLSFKFLPDGGLTKKFTLKELIDNVMLYWVSNSATTAARIYSESFSLAQLGLGMDRVPTKVPTAVARFPHEIVYPLEWQLKDKYPNLIQVTDLPKGGHFAALEEPELLAENLRLAVVKFEAFHLNKTK